MNKIDLIAIKFVSNAFLIVSEIRLLSDFRKKHNEIHQVTII